MGMTPTLPMIPAPALPNVTPSVPIGLQQLSDARATATLPAPKIGPINLSGGNGLPAIPAPSLSPVTMNPHVASSPNSGDSQIYRDQNALMAARNAPAGGMQLHNPFLRGLARVADVAGSVFLPGLTTAIPGTTLHHNLLVNQAQQNLANDQKSAEMQAQTQNLNLQPQLKQQAAELANEKLLAQEQHWTDQTEAQKEAAKQRYLANLQAHGYTLDESDPTGQKVRPMTYEEMSPVQQANVDLRQSQEDAQEAMAELRAAQNDPSSPAYKLAWGKLQSALQNGAAATMRAKAYMGNYMLHAYNVGLDGSVLPGAPEIADASGSVTPVGSTNATQAVKAQNNVSRFNDVGGSLDSLDSSLKALRDKGGSLSSPSVIAALADTQTPTAQWFQSKAVQSLTPEERNAVVAVRNAREQIMGLRQSVGGGVSDSQVNRLIEQLPGASTPDYDMASREITALRQSIGRLTPGVTTAAGGLQIPGRKSPGGNAKQQPSSSGSADYVYVPGKGLVAQ